MQRRPLLLAALAAPFAAHAHHGWSSFDQERPLYLEGKAANIKWRNPHVEFMLEVAPDFRLPADLAQRSLPPQTAPVDGKALLAKAQAPRRKDRRWEVELAPLTRIESWKLAEFKPGTTVGVLGFTFHEEKGDAVLRAEYVFVDGKAYGLRSGPAT
jgi:hypothetical protein